MKKQACITFAIFGVLYTVTAQLSTNNAVIDGGTYQGDPGGLSFIPEVVFGPDRINGLNMTGTNTINAGTFSGGEGSSAFPQMIRSGGAGVAITGGTNIVHGELFQEAWQQTICLMMGSVLAWRQIMRRQGCRYLAVRYLMACASTLMKGVRLIFRFLPTCSFRGFYLNPVTEN